jgi:hypothetical protein
VDFLHQFWRLVVSKEDMKPPASRSGRRFARYQGRRAAFSARRGFASQAKMRWI